jgi:hypothetical protein
MKKTSIGLAEMWWWIGTRVEGADVEGYFPGNQSRRKNIVQPFIIFYSLGYRHDAVHHTKKAYTRGDVHAHRAEGLCSLLKPYLRVFRGVRKTNLSGYGGFFQFLRNFRQQNAFEQAELILQAALDLAIASRARRGEFVACFDHFDLLQTAIN